MQQSVWSTSGIMDIMEFDWFSMYHFIMTRTGKHKIWPVSNQTLTPCLPGINMPFYLDKEKHVKACKQATPRPYLEVCTISTIQSKTTCWPDVNCHYSAYVIMLCLFSKCGLPCSLQSHSSLTNKAWLRFCFWAFIHIPWSSTLNGVCSVVIVWPSVCSLGVFHSFIENLLMNTMRCD